jgi:hypothetical protein
VSHGTHSAVFHLKKGAEFCEDQGERKGAWATQWCCWTGWPGPLHFQALVPEVGRGSWCRWSAQVYLLGKGPVKPSQRRMRSVIKGAEACKLRCPVLLPWGLGNYWPALDSKAAATTSAVVARYVCVGVPFQVSLQFGVSWWSLALLNPADLT